MITLIVKKKFVSNRIKSDIWSWGFILWIDSLVINPVTR